MQKYFGGMVIAIAMLVLSPGFSLANEIVALQSPTASVSKKISTPLIQVAACMPRGSSCSSNKDCCEGNCDPKHNKCGR
jgi:hypothetical protein